MNTLRLFDKPTTITVHAGSGRHISARSLFSHLRDALEGCDLSGITTLTIASDGSVALDGETVYTPRRILKNVAKNARG